MMADFYPGSDPGLCIAAAPPQAITGYGQRAQRELVTQTEARALAARRDGRSIAVVEWDGTCWQPLKLD